MEGESLESLWVNPTTKKLLFVFYVIITGAITGAAFWGVGQTGLWTSVVALFVVSYIVLWGLITAE